MGMACGNAVPVSAGPAADISLVILKIGDITVADRKIAERRVLRAVSVWIWMV